MIETIVSKIFCNNCMAGITEHEKDGMRIPCPECGSVSRNFKDLMREYRKVTGRSNGDNNKY